MSKNVLCAFLTKSCRKICIGAQIEHFDRNRGLSLVTFFARLIIMLQFRNCFFVIPMLYLLQSFFNLKKKGLI